MTDPIIEVRDLRREFLVRGTSGRWLRRARTVVKAVDGLTFSIPEGAAVGYLGANGAGKSTTIKMLSGILVPTSGVAHTCGLEPVRDRSRLARQIGVVFGQRSQLWWDLPLSESFRVLGAIHRLSPAAQARRTDELIERLDLGGFISTSVRQLSLGQRIRGEVAAALLHSPRLLILDEPTIGLDVLSKERLRNFLVEQRQLRGTSLLLATHDMGDVQRLTERVIVVDHGRSVYDGTLPGIAELVGAERIMVVQLAAPVPPLDHIPDTRLVGVEREGTQQRLSFVPAETTAARILELVGQHAQVQDLTLEEPDIDDVIRKLYLRTAEESVQS
ncbi:ABC transporter ATP-binding protein [Actinoplanes utahensis]|uniref:Methionine ABC transporter ATP-binding protein n=1 Tax=Actinoplanes utahensis TaxID=1869 RepID=A0A0A6U7N3_ACTUT|nr:ATP-binding cassette domain-containing protein [Actinoplanes utahensis]KHD72075.1 methionine ABC transporter ATP-binding protein [Actinoplanes utahensis]GIF28818.1 methionine ABC transporter ATP-binding protein [Actinoplanes utahensis]